MQIRTFLSELSKYWWAKELDKIFFLIALGVFFLFYPGQNSVAKSFRLKVPFLQKLPFVVPAPAPYPVNQTNVYPGAEISAGGVVATDVDSGVILYRRNDEELLAPASTTKIMTALVALDYYDLDQEIIVRNLVKDGQTIGLIPGERITVENLLYGALVASGNDSAWVLSDNYPGGVDAFVAAMNKKAQDLHLLKTHFTNPVGYDDPAHKMTAFDLARLASVALANKTIAKMVAIPQITISDVTHTYFHPLKNVNELLGKIPGVGGIKTGWTEEAGENLITLVQRNDHRVILVVLHSRDRFGDTTRLIDWVFTNYRWEKYNP